jgi:hypothetical protein
VLAVAAAYDCSMRKQVVVKQHTTHKVEECSVEYIPSWHAVCIRVAPCSFGLGSSCLLAYIRQ